MMSYAAERMTRFQEVLDVARRITTGPDVGILRSGWGLMIDSRIPSISVAFIPVPIWDTNTHALDTASAVVSGRSGTR